MQAIITPNSDLFNWEWFKIKSLTYAYASVWCVLCVWMHVQVNLDKKNKKQNNVCPQLFWSLRTEILENEHNQKTKKERKKKIIKKQK